MLFSPNNPRTGLPLCKLMFVCSKHTVLKGQRHSSVQRNCLLSLTLALLGLNFIVFVHICPNLLIPPNEEFYLYFSSKSKGLPSFQPSSSDTVVNGASEKFKRTKSSPLLFSIPCHVIYFKATETIS